MILGHYQLKMSLKGVERWTGEIFNSVSRFSFMLGSTLWMYTTHLSNAIVYEGGTKTIPLYVSCCVCGRHYIKYMLSKFILKTEVSA